MRDRAQSLMLEGMVALFTAGGKAKVIDCTIDGFCRTSIYEFSGAAVEPGAEIEPRIICQKNHFRASIVGDLKAFLRESSFSPHYTKNCALRHDIDEILKGLRKTTSSHRENLFVVIEEHREIEPVRMSKGECISINQEFVRGGISGNESILALRSQDGAWPEERPDISSENTVLAAIKIEQNVTYGMKPLIESINFVERGGEIVNIQEGYVDLAFDALRSTRKLSNEALYEKAQKLSSSILILEETMKQPPFTELITALRLEDTREKVHLCLWYLHLWEASCKAGALIGSPQFSNPDGAKVGQNDRRCQLDHRNDVAHGRVNEIDFTVFDKLQIDVLDLLRKNVLYQSKRTRNGC